jgi:hypothetical protein
MISVSYATSPLCVCQRLGRRDRRRRRPGGSGIRKESLGPVAGACEKCWEMLGAAARRGLRRAGL